MSHQDFVTACNNSIKFPECYMRRSNSFQHTMKNHVKRLDSEESRLFHAEENAELNLWECCTTAGYVPVKISNFVQLENHLMGPSSAVKKDPQARFIFIHAKHSRDSLKVTRKMLMYAFTYHQVMPTFLDYLFLFGKLKFSGLPPQGFHFSGFRSESTLFSKKMRLPLPDLGRSGLDYSMCYNLKSVEPSNPLKEPRSPWLVRQTAIYHSFDIDTCKAFWVSVKGNSSIRDRIAEMTAPAEGRIDIVNSKANAFTESLNIHLLMIEWCAENWRWYIDYLELLSDEKTTKALLSREDAPAPKMRPTPLSRACTAPADSANPLVRAGTWLKRQSTFPRTAAQSSVPLATINPTVPESQNFVVEKGEGFSFSNLQEVQNFEDKTNDVLLMLESNINITSHIRDFYKTIFESSGFPKELKDECQGDITRFTNEITSVVSDLKMQLARAKMLRAQITDRKNLLYGILNYRSMEASKNFAEEARKSTNNMEGLTRQMNALAQKTKQETVSMRIITLVTLFFLPGTFISTLMSTDIIKYSNNVEDFSPNALWLFLKVTAPLMVATFISWWVVYKWVHWRQEVLQQRKLQAEKDGTTDSIV